MEMRFRKNKQIIRIIISVYFILLLTDSQYLLSSSKHDTTLKLKHAKIKDELSWPFNFQPYIVEFKHNNGAILYYGSYHNVNLQHPQFQDIEDRWNTFKPDVAFSEGEKWPLVRSREDAIKRYGEQGLLRYLAYRDKVKIKCIEPKRISEMLYLLKHFPAPKIKIYYVLRQILINREIFKKDLDTVDYVKIYLMNISWIKPFGNSPRTLEEFSLYIKKYLPDLKNWEKIDSNYFMDITKPNNFLARINIHSNKFRDQFMTKKIIRALEKGRKIFFVVGKSHVFNQERILLSLARPK